MRKTPHSSFLIYEISNNSGTQKIPARRRAKNTQRQKRFDTNRLHASGVAASYLTTNFGSAPTGHTPKYER
jgi:hypothetical protein